MIVKTGANYQDDGGYIEASKTGTNVIVTIDNDKYNFKTDAVNISSLYKTTLRLAEGLTGPIYFSGLSRDGDAFVPTGVNVTNSDVEKYAGGDVVIFMAIGGTTGITNPVLAEGSRNTVIEKISTAGARIYVTGPDAVAIIKENA